MSDRRDYEYTYKDGGWFDDSEATLEDSSTFYTISGKDADKFNELIKHSSTNLEIEETDYGVHIRDKNTGKTFSATKSTDYGIFEVITLIVAIICTAYITDVLPILVTTPAILLSMIHTLPWGPFLFVGMLLLCRLALKKLDYLFIERYKTMLMLLSLVLTVLSLLIMRFVYQEPCLLDYTLGSFFNDIPAFVSITILWFSVCNVFFLINGATLRNKPIIRLGIYHQILIPMTAMILCGMACALMGLPMNLSHETQHHVTQTFLERLPYTQWYWLTDLLDQLIFSRRPLIVALIALISGIVLARVEDLIHFLRNRAQRKRRRKQAGQKKQK